MSENATLNASFDQKEVISVETNPTPISPSGTASGPLGLPDGLYSEDLARPGVPSNPLPNGTSLPEGSYKGQPIPLRSDFKPYTLTVTKSHPLPNSTALTYCLPCACAITVFAAEPFSSSISYCDTHTGSKFVSNA